MAEIMAENNITASPPMNPVPALAISLVGEYLGSYAAHMYEQFYAGKDDSVIFESVNELLTEVVGKTKADELVKDKFKNISGLTL